MQFKHTLNAPLFTAMTITSAVAVTQPATAQEAAEPTQVEMMALIRAQAERIRSLETRLGELEQKADGRADAIATAPPVPAIAQSAQNEQAMPPSGATRRPPIDPEMHVHWESGVPEMESADGSFSFRPRGRIMLDIDSTFGSRFSSRNLTSTGARAARLGFEGTLFDKAFYTFDVEFAEPSVTEVLSAFIGYQDKWGKLEYDVRIGNMFNDRSLEGQTGSQNTPLLERNFVANAIMPRRAFYGMGSMFRVYGPRWHASVTIAGDPIDGAVNTSDSLSLSGRTHWNPVKTDDMTVHLGLWGFKEWLRGEGRNISRNTLVGARFNTKLRVATGPLEQADRTTGYGAEFALVHRNLYAWAEYGRRDLVFLTGATIRDFSIDAWSVAAGWVLTGEKAPYSARQGNFKPMRIKRSLANGGIGAFELVARHQQLDNSRTPLGGLARETTLGLNWYPAAMLRFTVNWSRWYIDNLVAPFDQADDGDAIGMRAQLVF